jgi:hypothetical protein
MCKSSKQETARQKRQEIFTAVFLVRIIKSREKLQKATEINTKL